MLRRDFLKFSAITATLLGISIQPTHANIQPSVLKTTIAIAGAGFAGLSVAKELKRLNPSLDIVLIEKKTHFMSCPFSNVWLGEIQQIQLEDLVFDYHHAINQFGYHFLNATIIDIDKEKKLITTNTHTILYDYLILATGIEYDYEQLFQHDREKAQECLHKAPPALKPGSEHLALKRMITHFKKGNFVITIPAQNYKCPPAPYERACMIAHYFKTHQIEGKVLILDPRDKPAAKPSAFLEAFKKYYPDIIEYHNNTLFKDIHFKKKLIEIEVFNKKLLDFETQTIAFEEACIIPPNKASTLIKKAKLATYKQGWAKLKQPTFRSISDDDIYVIGDAQGEYPYPKSAQMANSCGYIVAQELNNRIHQKSFDYKNNLPGNICYSMINNHKAVSISHLFEYKDTLHTSAITSAIDEYTAQAAKGWYFGLIEDILAIQIK